MNCASCNDPAPVPCPQEAQMNMESLSKPELLMLFSVLEGELEARDLVIEALRVRAIHRLSPCVISSQDPKAPQ